MEKTINTIREYEDLVRSTRVYPEKQAIIYPTLGMCEEAGEASGKVSKWLRGDRGDLDKSSFAAELGDVIWNAVAAGIDVGYTFEEILNMNAEKLLSRKERGVIKGDGDNR